MEQKRNTENGGFLGLRSMASGSKTGDAEHGGKSTYASSAAESEDPSKKSDPKSVDECNIELKLGKRAFYGVAVKAVATGQAQAKKARGLPHMSQTPRCQVEGCDEELSNAKDYHKRHKVCEVHSKTAQVRVNGMDQRFCQQCSRFHELKEFDEGKRSCRRRLKGHNERRRKQPYQTGLNATRLPLSFNDSRFGSLFTDRPFLIHPRFNPNPVLQDIGDFKSDIGKRTWPRILKSENETYEHLHIPTIQQHSYAAPGKVLTFLQGSKPSYSTSAVSGHDYSHYIPSSGSPVGQALSLSSSGTDISGVTCAFQRLPGVSDSGRALSLLSTQSWIPRSSSASDTVASISSMDQMINNQSHMGQIVMQGLQQNYELAEDKILTISSQAQSNIVSNGYSTTAGNSSLNKQHNNGTGLVSNNGGLGSFDMRMPGLFQVPGIGCPGDATSQDARCTINLMCRSSNAQSNESHVESDSGLNGNSPFSICESGRSYDSTIFYPQQML